MKRLSVLLALSALPAWAGPCTDLPADTKPINAAWFFIEDNAGDGDLGVQGYFDDETWTELCVFAPDGSLLLTAKPDGVLGKLGLSSISFESNEPPYADWTYEALRAAFPEGRYAVRGITNDGRGLTGSALFTTLVPLAPEILEPATVPEETDTPPKVPVADLTVAWRPVTGSRDGRKPKITGYQVTVEKKNHEDPNGASRPLYDIHVGPDRTSVLVPQGFFDPGSLYELEVLAIEESGNQTIGGASFFATE